MTTKKPTTGENQNIVTCGMCAKIIVHEKGLETLKCEHCLFEDDISDFPDLHIWVNDVRIINVNNYI